MSHDLTAAVDAAARTHFARGQAERRDDGRTRPDGQPWQWEDLDAVGQHAVRSFVLPIVTAAFESLVDHDRILVDLAEAATREEIATELSNAGFLLGGSLVRRGSDDPEATLDRVRARVAEGVTS